MELSDCLSMSFAGRQLQPGYGKISCCDQLLFGVSIPTSLLDQQFIESFEEYQLPLTHHVCFTSICHLHPICYMSSILAREPHSGQVTLARLQFLVEVLLPFVAKMGNAGQLLWLKFH